MSKKLDMTLGKFIFLAIVVSLLGIRAGWQLHEIWHPTLTCECRVINEK